MSKISQKKSPRINDPNMQNAFNRLYDHINEIVLSVNSNSSDSDSLGDGKKGDIRVIQGSDREVKLEIRVEDGCFESKLFDIDPDIDTSTITDLNVTQSSVAVTANGSVTISNGAAPSNDEIYELAIETNAKITALNSKLKEVIGIINDMNVNGFNIINKRNL